MIGAVLYKTGDPLVIEPEIEIPPLKRGQVLVKIAYSGICHSQLMEVRGARGEDKYLPHLLGHEASGVVESIGEEVTKVKPGDHVILGWIRGSGIEAGGTVYSCRGKAINSGAVTTFSDRTVVSENRIALLPKDVPMDVAVLFGCALLTGAGIVTQQIKPEPGAKVVVFGLGGIGMSALMAAQLFDPALLIAVDVSDEKLQLAKELGASHTIRPDKTDVVQEIRELTGGLGADYAVEAAGLTKTIEQAFSSIRRGGGKCVFASHPKNGEKIQIDPYELICGKKIEGSWGGGSNPDRDIPMFANHYREGNLPLRRLLSKQYRLEEINEALDDLENHRVGRPLLAINPGLV